MLALTAISFVMAALLGACAGDPANESTPTPTDDPSPTAAASPTTTAEPTPGRVAVADPGFTLAPADSTTLEAVLAAVPDTPETRASLRFDDFEAVRDQFGIEAPGPDADRSAVVDYLMDLMSPMGDGAYGAGFVARENWLFGMHNYLNGSETFPYVALDQRNADQNVVAGNGQSALEITLGRFDPEMTETALNECDECPGHETAEHSGETFYSWGEDFGGSLRNRMAPPVFDQLGRGGRLWVTEDIAVRTLYTEGMENVIDARHGNMPSLADDDDFALAARALSGLEIHTAVLSDADRDIDSMAVAIVETGREEDLVREAILSAPLLQRFTMSVVGTGFDADGTSFTAVVLVHDDESTAEENVDRLVTRVQEGDVAGYGWPTLADNTVGSTPTVVPESRSWADVIDSIELSTDGRVLLAKLYGSVNAHALIPSSAFLGSVPAPNGLLVYE